MVVIIIMIIVTSVITIIVVVINTITNCDLGAWQRSAYGQPQWAEADYWQISLAGAFSAIPATVRDGDNADVGGWMYGLSHAMLGSGVWSL
jgi:hypothetical protein